MRILVLANNDVGLYRFREELVENLTCENEVYICLPYGEFIPELEKMGCKYLKCIHLVRRGTNPTQDMKLFLYYIRILRQIRPDAVLTYTIKPNVYGGMACAMLNVPYAANITGRGTAVNDGGLLQKITLFLYRRGLKKAKKVFFQNSDDLVFMQERHVICGDYELLPGSGVNLERNRFEPYPKNDDKETFLYIGRLMEVKGIEELVKAAEYICTKYNNVRFVAIGSCEPDYQKTFDKLQADKYISLEGTQDNVHEWIKQATAIVHPSHLEGMSNVLLEAAATGRPVIATDIPGCRETFDEGVSGFSFKPSDVDSLCEAIEKFIALPYEKKVEMGRAGREKMEREFDRQIVVDRYMELVRQIEEENAK